jgi:osmotically-inducible protein OsmY
MTRSRWHGPEDQAYPNQDARWEANRDRWTTDDRESRYDDRRGYPGSSRTRGWIDRDDDQRDRWDRSAGSSLDDFEQARYRGEAQLGPRRHDRSASWPIMASPEEQFYGGFGGNPERNRQLAGRHGEDDRSTRDRYREDDSRSRHGYFDRAREEIASWVGGRHGNDRGDERHRGRGPAGYTRSDERISDDVHDILTDDVGVDASGITVTVADGEVVLNGSVPTRYQKRRAEDCVENVSGVRHVQNNLRVQEER